jgi:predicted protein tyrosine phosphatase
MTRLDPSVAPYPLDSAPDIAPDLVWIDPLFAIGRRPDPPQRPLVRALGIDAVVSLHTPDPGEHASWETLGIRFVAYPTVDWEEISAERFAAVVAAVTSHQESGRRVLLHCIAGLNRAPTFAAALLSLRDAMTPDEAVQRIRQVRPAIAPTEDQLRSLRRWIELRRLPRTT